MPLTIEKLPGVPILVTTQHEMDIRKELDETLARLIAALDAQAEPVFMVYDTRGISMDLSDALLSASAATRGSSAMAHHLNLRETIVVTDTDMVRIAAQSARSATFGMVRVSIFETLEEALAYCYGRLGIAQPGPDH